MKKAFLVYPDNFFRVVVEDSNDESVLIERLKEASYRKMAELLRENDMMITYKDDTEVPYGDGRDEK